MTCSALERTRSSPERPSSSANSRNTSSPKPWKVLIAASFKPSGVLMSTRSCIPAAAFSVKVTARISCGFAARDSMRWTTRAVRTCVFPVPAPATMSSGPVPCSTARRCSSVRPPRMLGFGSPSPKASCSVTRRLARRRSRARGRKHFAHLFYCNRRGLCPLPPPDQLSARLSARATSVRTAGPCGPRGA